MAEKHARQGDVRTERGATEAEAVADSGERTGSKKRLVVRAFLHPELGMSFAGVRESTGAFADLVSAAWEGVRRGRTREWRRRRGIGVVGWVLVVSALGCVGYGAAVLLGGLVVFVVPQAHGQVVDSGILGGSDDRTRELLDFLYGVASGGGFGIGEMLRYFNAAVLVVVGVVLLYEVLFAVVETGRTGEGRLTGWQVMRLVVGVALIFPLPASGMGPGQHIFLGLIDAGGNIATGVWSRFAHVIVGGGPGAPLAMPQGHRDLVAKMVMLETCMHVHNGVAAAAGHGPYITVMRTETDAAVRYDYRDADGGGRYRSCGHVVVSVAGGGDNPGAVMLANAHYSAVGDAGFQARLREAGRELGDRYLPNHPTSGEPLPEVDGWLRSKGLVRIYEDRLRRVMGAAARASQAALEAQVTAAIAEEGWLSAATFFSVISRNQAALYDGLSAVPSVGESRRRYRRWATVDAWEEAAPEIERWLLRSDVVGPSGRVTTQRDDLWSALRDLILPSVHSIAHLDEGKPLEELVGMGHTLVGTGMGAILVGGVGSLAGVPARLAGRIASLAGRAVEAVSGPVAAVFGLVKMLAWALVFVGVLLAYVLPLIPFVRFLFGIVSWVISVVEGLVAVPLFLALQVGGRGRGLVSREAKAGYLLVLHAVVRPALMVLGLVFAYFIFVAAIGLFNWLYAGHLEGIENATTAGVLTAFVSLMIYTFVAFGVANAAFKAIDVVPQEVMRWLGGYARGGGEEAGGSLGILTRSVMRGKSPPSVSSLRGR